MQQRLRPGLRRHGIDARRRDGQPPVSQFRCRRGHGRAPGAGGGDRLQFRRTGKLKLAAKPEHYDKLARTQALLAAQADPDTRMVSRTEGGRGRYAALLRGNALRKERRHARGPLRPAWRRPPPGGVHRYTSTRRSPACVASPPADTRSLRRGGASRLLRSCSPAASPRSGRWAETGVASCRSGRSSS